MSTIDFYQNNSDAYIAQTLHTDMSQAYEMFERYLPVNAHILDIGCGSGRDSRYFARHYQVSAIDPVPAFVAHAKLFLQDVYLMAVEEMPFDEAFDGIWACASLLHLTPAALKLAFERCARALKKGGVMYASFKYGTFQGEIGGRYFTYMTEETLMPYLTAFDVLEMTITGDQLAQRDLTWLNVVLKKKADGHYE